MSGREFRSMIAVVGFAFAAVGCGGGGDDDPDGSAAATLSGADILAKLLEVDGEGSGLDCDTVDGLDSAALARAGSRTIQVPLAQPGVSVLLSGAGNTNFHTRLLVPADAAADQPLTARILTRVVTGAPCDVDLSPDAVRVVPGDPDVVPETATLSGGQPFAVSASNQPQELTFTVTGDPGEIAPGAWLAIGIDRFAGDPSDSCGDDLELMMVAIDYQGT